MIKSFSVAALLAVISGPLFAREEVVPSESGNGPIVESVITPDSAPHVSLPSSHAFIGVELLPVDQPTRELFKMKREDAGMLVIGIAPGSPCDGVIGQGDIILKANDFPISVKGNLRTFLWDKKGGDYVVFTLLRGGVEKKATIRLAERPAGLALAFSGDNPGSVVQAEMMRRLLEHTRQAAGENRDFFSNASRDVALLGSGSEVHSRSTRLITKPEGTVVIFKDDGVTSVVVTDRDGNTVVSGKLDDALRRKVPDWARSASEELASEAPASEAKPAPVAKPGA